MILYRSDITQTVFRKYHTYACECDIFPYIYNILYITREHNIAFSLSLTNYLELKYKNACMHASVFFVYFFYLLLEYTNFSLINYKYNEWLKFVCRNMFPHASYSKY